MTSNKLEMIGHYGNVADNLQSTEKPFPFLKLPAEIRNEIYRLVLITENVSSYKPAANHRRRTPGEGNGDLTSALSGVAADGTIRCEAWRTYRLVYQVSILRANRQIYREARGIFQLENFWTIVRINKAGFGKEMKDRGFPVATAYDIWRYIKFPIMKVTVVFPNLESEKQSDDLLIAPAHLKQLIRVLWTCKGASEMEVMINVQPPFTKKSPSDQSLLQPFFKLRGINQVIILGPSTPAFKDELSRAMTTTDGISQSFSDMMASVKCLQRHIKTQRWEQAVAQAENHSMLMADCKTVYDNDFLGVDPDLSLHASILRCHAIKELVVATAMSMAEVTLHLHQYDSTIRFAQRGLEKISRVATFFQHLIHTHPAIFAPPAHQVFVNPRTLTWEKKTKCSILLIRARAYMGMRKPRNASQEIEKAREVMPDSETLASVSETWQAMFGPLSASTPAAS